MSAASAFVACVWSQCRHRRERGAADRPGCTRPRHRSHGCRSRREREQLPECRAHACPRASAPPCLPTIWAMPGTWSWPGMASSTSTPGAAATTATTAAARGRLSGRAQGHDGHRQGRRDRALRRRRRTRRPRRHRHRDLSRRLYAEINDRIVRYALAGGSIVPTAAAEVIVSGLPLSGDHPMHPFAIDARRRAVRRCRVGDQLLPGANRMLKSPGISRARSSRRAAASGATTPTRRASSSRRRSATPPGSATPTASPSTRAGTDLCDPTRPRSAQRELAEALQAGTGGDAAGGGAAARGAGGDYGWPECYFDEVQRSSCSRPDMAAMAARRSASARRARAGRLIPRSLGAE